MGYYTQPGLRALSGVVLLLLGGAGCMQTEPGEKTAVAAATGGVIGAGLGAIIGNQTGSTAGGMAIGGVAGAGAGAMIGNSLEAREKTLLAQDEDINRREQAIQAQRRELEELRRQNGDGTTVGMSAGPRGQVSRTDAALVDPDHERLARAYARAHPLREGEVKAGKKQAAAESVKPSARKSIPVIEMPAEADAADAPTAKPQEAQAFATDARQEDAGKGAYDWSQSAFSEKSQESALGSSECETAREEIEKGESVRETADKLFHYRRALRLCPNNAEYHVKLAEVYQSLDRPTDAAYEFKEALNLDPENNGAHAGLASLGR